MLLFGIAICLTAYSSGEINFLNGNTALFVFLFLLFVAVLGTLVASIWFKGSLKDNLLKAGKIVFPVTAIVFLLGYFYITLITIL